LAQLAYEEVVRIDRHDKTAWVGLTVALTAQGRVEEAARYGKKVERYQRRNPYYNFALVEAAFGKHDYPGALGFVEAAINLRKSDADFYSLHPALSPTQPNFPLPDAYQLGAAPNLSLLAR
jgi:tetratricopeptide (TPR) repeat protein